MVSKATLIPAREMTPRVVMLKEVNLPHTYTIGNITPHPTADLQTKNSNQLWHTDATDTSLLFCLSIRKKFSQHTFKHE